MIDLDTISWLLLFFLRVSDPNDEYDDGDDSVCVCVGTYWFKETFA